MGERKNKEGGGQLSLEEHYKTCFLKKNWCLTAAWKPIDVVHNEQNRKGISNIVQSPAVKQHSLLKDYKCNTASAVVCEGAVRGYAYLARSLKQKCGW